MQIRQTKSEEKTEKREFKSGATSTKQPRLSLIPHAGLVNAAERFELGLARHGEKAYNNLSNQDPLEDFDWLLERASHAIEHSYRVIDILRKYRTGDLLTQDQIETLLGDSGAIAWAGLVLGEAFKQMEK